MTLQNFSGVIQRLVQKEKQVLQLQAEVDRLSASGKRAEDVSDFVALLASADSSLARPSQEGKG